LKYRSPPVHTKGTLKSREDQTLEILSYVDKLSIPIPGIGKHVELGAL
jgi:hypothetical protein